MSSKGESADKERLIDDLKPYLYKIKVRNQYADDGWHRRLLASEPSKAAMKHPDNEITIVWWDRHLHTDT